jgi:hypothetical protein
MCDRGVGTLHSLSMIAAAATWSFGLWRLARGRVRADWRFLVGVWLLLASATTLLASGVVYGDAVALGSLRAAIRAAPQVDQGVLVDSSLNAAQLTSADPSVRDGLASMLGAPGGSITLELRSGSLVRIGGPGNGATGSPSLTLLESVDDAAAHAQLTSGRWPERGATPTEGVLTEGATAALGVHVGDVVELGDASTPGASASHPVASVVVVGIFRPNPNDPAWSGDELDLHGVGTINGVGYQGPFVVDQRDLTSRELASAAGSRLDARWRAVPDLERLSADDIEPLRARLDAMPGQIHASFPPGGTVNVGLGLEKLLDSLGTSLQVARGAVLVLTLQFAVVAAYAVFLISGMLADRRRPEIGLLRSRGASTTHVAALAFGEAVLLTLPAVAVAPVIAVELVRLLGGFGPLAASGAVADATISPNTLAIIGITGLIAALVLALPALASGAEVAGIRALLGRPVARTLAQRLGIDVALLAVAAIAIWQLRAYGQPLTRDLHGALGLDPLLAAAPAFGLVAGAVIATRLVPRLGELGERVLGRTNGILSPLAVRQIARRPLRYTRAALLLILASALGTFGAVYATTWAASHADQAAYQAGADVRVSPTAGGGFGAWSFGSVFRSTPGVVAAVPVTRSSLAIGTVVRNGALIAANDAILGGIVTFPPGADAASLPGNLAALAAARPTVATIALPPGTRWLRVELDAALTEQPISFGDEGEFKVPPDYRGITITAVVEDADGLVTPFSMPPGAPSGLFKGKGQTFDLPLSDAANRTGGAADPRVLIGLELSLTNALGQFANPIEGSIALTGVAVSTEQGTATAEPAEWAPLGLATVGVWRWQEADGRGSLEDIASGPSATLPNESDFASLGEVEVRLSPNPPDDTSIPTIAGDQLLAVTGSDVGQTLGASVGGVPVELRVTGHAPDFPTVAPATPFALVDAPTLGLLTYLGDNGVGGRTEWWLRTDPGASTSVATALAASALPSSSIVDRARVLASLDSDPVGLGTLGALLLGSVAATAFAVIGFLVGASVATRERLGEFALLRALGLAPRQLWRWLAAENAFLLALGVLAGTAIGLLLGWLIVPATLLGASGEPVVPAPILEVPWPLIGLVYVAAAGLLVATILFVGRPLPGRSVAAILRATAE